MSEHEIVWFDYCARCGEEHGYMCGPCESCGHSIFTKERLVLLSGNEVDEQVPQLVQLHVDSSTSPCLLCGNDIPDGHVCVHEAVPPGNEVDDD